MKPHDLIKWTNLNRILGNQRAVWTPKRLPKKGIKKQKIDELLSFIEDWIKSL